VARKYQEKERKWMKRKICKKRTGIDQRKEMSTGP
jgi:hypothetical protein